LNEIYQIATKYFIEMESFSAYGGIKNKYFWKLGGVALIILFGSIYFFDLTSFAYNKLNIKNTNIIIFISSLIVVILEMYLLITFDNLQKYKDKLITKKYNMNDISSVKIELLKEYFSIQQNDFLYVAKEINGMLNLNNSKFKNKHLVDKIFYFILNSDSKNRILSLFILMCSMLTIIFINFNDTNYFLENINALTSQEIKIFFFRSLFLFSILYIVIFFSYKIIRKILIFISIFFITKKSEDIEIVKYLISDLVKYSIINKDNLENRC